MLCAASGDLGRTPSLIDAEVSHDVLELVGTGKVRVLTDTTSAAGERSTEIVGATATLLFGRDRGRQTVAELSGVSNHDLAAVARVRRGGAARVVGKPPPTR